MDLLKEMLQLEEDIQNWYFDDKWMSQNACVWVMKGYPQPFRWLVIEG